MLLIDLTWLLSLAHLFFAFFAATSCGCLILVVVVVVVVVVVIVVVVVVVVVVVAQNTHCNDSESFGSHPIVKQAW